MKAQDLRIGNWVEIKDVTHAPKTWQIEGVGNLIQVGGQLWSIEEIEPIPLTEKWLVKFGFEYNFDENPTKNQLTIEKHFNGCWFRVLDGMWSDGIKIDYVHQLQNLYFALTGEELTVKEPA